jgi:8-amino-7-oxononanoate synthase
MKIPKTLQQKILFRKDSNALRNLPIATNGIDFSSNDYLGFAKNEEIFETTHQYLVENNIKVNGATGSRLISGNHSLYAVTEKYIATFHQLKQL